MSDLDDMLARLVDMEKDVVSGSDGVPVTFYTQEALPYWTNAVGTFSVEQLAQDLQLISYQVKATLVLAKATEGFGTEAEEKAHALLPVILLYFGQRRTMKRNNTDPDVVNLYPRGLSVTGGAISDNIPSSGVGDTMFGCEVQLDIPMYQSIDQVVF